MKLPAGAIRSWLARVPIVALLLPAAANADLTSKTQLRLPANERIAAWHRLLVEQHADEFGKVLATHRFFAGFAQQDDATLWGVPDRWAMPREFVEIGAGDCEDFAVARYATLVALGGPPARLALATTYSYSTERRRIERHMVLAYRPSANDATWILDNRIPTVARMETRKDLGRLDTAPQLQALEARLIRLGAALAASARAAQPEPGGYAKTGPVPSVLADSSSAMSGR